MINNDFLSKEFVYCDNAAIINSIVDFIKNIDDKVEIGLNDDKRVNAKSLLKVMALLADCKNENIIIYCYGSNKEHNLQIIEDFLYKNQFYSLEEIENKEKEKISNYEREIEEEILSLTPDNKKEYVRSNIKTKIRLLKEKKDKKHEQYSNIKNILYIKDNNKIKIHNFIKEDIISMIKKLASFYEININSCHLESFENIAIYYINTLDIKYFYKDVFFNNIQKYFIDTFNNIYIKKIIDSDYTEDIEYNTECLNSIINEAIKTFDYILKNKRQIVHNIFDTSTNEFNPDCVKSSIIAIISNLALVYEVDNNLINEDLIAFASKVSHFIGEISLSGMNNNDILLKRSIINYFQKQFEYAYISIIIGEEFPIIEYDFNYIKRFI